MYVSRACMGLRYDRFDRPDQIIGFVVAAIVYMARPSKYLGALTMLTSTIVRVEFHHTLHSMNLIQSLQNVAERQVIWNYSAIVEFSHRS